MGLDQIPCLSDMPLDAECVVRSHLRLSEADSNKDRIQSMQTEDIATGWEMATIVILALLQQHRQRGTSIPLAVGSWALVEDRRALRACLLGALAKLPGPGSELRRPILVAWGQDRCLGGVLPGRAASKQARMLACHRIRRFQMAIPVAMVAIESKVEEGTDSSTFFITARSSLHS